MKPISPAVLFTSLGSLIVGTGCAVPQKPGRGTVSYQTEATTRRGYYLYLPEDYVKSQGQRPGGGRWPVVVTFHGMEPWDTAGRQIRECQQEADRYGFLVIAPHLDTSNSWMQYPLKDPNLSYVKRDEQAVIAIMDEVFRQTNADPTRVLATSWSCGGYMAHFLVNRYPERFSCLAVRQSNFSEALLDPNQVPKYRHMKIGIFFGENDLPACRNESTRAVDWYRSRGFYVEAKLVEGLAHERTPQTAVGFFAATLGIPPKTPPDLGTMVMRDVVPEGGRFRTVNGGGGSKTSSGAPAGYSMGANGTNGGTHMLFGPG
ncbi:MAG: prolyl oligopeptidase family serine peptidase, partial [Phycisphaerae bacterium]